MTEMFQLRLCRLST